MESKYSKLHELQAEVNNIFSEMISNGEIWKEIALRERKWWNPMRYLRGRYYRSKGYNF